MFALSGVGRGLAITQLAVVVSEVDSEWKEARSANPKERKKLLESGHLKPRECYLAMTLWQMLMKLVLKMGRMWTLLRILFIGEHCYLGVEPLASVAKESLTQSVGSMKIPLINLRTDQLSVPD